MTIYTHIPETAPSRQPEKLKVICSESLFQMNLPIHKLAIQAAILYFTLAVVFVPPSAAVPVR